jgi:DNA-binding NarL/FixJ family response regulator/class 3 adenylate cyclase
MPDPAVLTLLFTDLVGSTQLLDALGDDRAEELHRRHFELLRSAAEAHGGREVKKLGDGLMVAFSSAAGALFAAVTMQQVVSEHNRVSEHELSIRIGLNAGEPIPDESDYFGSAVVLAKRLCDRAEGGQILLSDVVRQLVGTRGAFSFRSLGETSLKGFAFLVPVWELVWRETGPTPLSSATPAPPISVVLVDDEELVREGLKLILEAEPDIEVVGEAGDGRMAIDLISRLRPDVALMDIQMPGLDGLSATAAVASAGASTRVVVLTTFDYDENVLRALRAGASAFLLKNAPRAQLATAVRVAARGDALLDPAVTRRLIEHFVRTPPAPTQVPGELAELSPKELEVMRLVARGLSNAEIAEELVVSITTVKTHVARILMKLGLRDRAQVVVKAYETGFALPRAAS